jgi:hypothetical protein
VFSPDPSILDLPSGWNGFGPETIRGDPGRPHDLDLLGIDPSASGGAGTGRVIIADAAEWTTIEHPETSTVIDHHLPVLIRRSGRPLTRRHFAAFSTCYLSRGIYLII